MELKEAQSAFIQHWAQLGSSWGINKTMAQIHALLLISPDALTTEETMERLQISRGNANMNLRALQDWGLVYKEHHIGERKEFFKAEKDINKVARSIARERRKREIEPVTQIMQQLSAEKFGDSKDALAFQKVTKDIHSFSGKVDGLLDKFSRSDENWIYATLFKLVK
jgi:DNA-binding transcriptional regulator GbsR (MarR family)